MVYQLHKVGSVDQEGYEEPEAANDVADDDDRYGEASVGAVRVLANHTAYERILARVTLA